VGFNENKRKLHFQSRGFSGTIGGNKPMWMLSENKVGRKSMFLLFSLIRILFISKNCESKDIPNFRPSGLSQRNGGVQASEILDWSSGKINTLGRPTASIKYSSTQQE